MTHPQYIARQMKKEKEADVKITESIQSDVPKSEIKKFRAQKQASKQRKAQRELAAAQSGYIEIILEKFPVKKRNVLRVALYSLKTSPEDFEKLLLQE